MQIALVAFVAFVIAALSGHWLIPALRKLHFGQSILEIGPNWHKNKEGTPTMGGIMFIIGILAASCLAFLFMADAPATEKIKYGRSSFSFIYLTITSHNINYIRGISLRTLQPSLVFRNNIPG